MHLFWATTNTFTLAFYVALKNPQIRKALNIPLRAADQTAAGQVVLLNNKPSTGTVASGGHSTAKSLMNRKKQQKSA